MADVAFQRDNSSFIADIICHAPSKLHLKDSTADGKALPQALRDRCLELTVSLCNLLL